MSAVLKKGAPSRSYPSRQRKLGPAPFASFEDLSDELESPGQPGDDSSNKVSVMPEIKEDRLNERAAACQSPTMTMPGDEEGTPDAVRAHRNVTATSSTSTVTFAPSYSAPTSGPTSGLQTPSTPRIDISCASSSTPPSDESASEKELFQGGLGLAFHEEAVDDLRSSTEELDLGEEEISSEEERRRRRLEEQEMRESDTYRRSSHPANIFSRKPSVPAAPPPPDDAQRKPSAHSLFLEGLLNRPCRHASFGHGDYMRPGAVSSLSTHSAGSGQRSRSRSPSPHKLMFETSFCGAKPIPTKSMEAESPPKDKELSSSAPMPEDVHSQQSTSVVTTAVPPLSPPSRFSDDSRSLKSPKKMVTPGWERHPELEQVCQAEGPKDIDTVSRSKTPLSPQPSSLGFDSRRPSAGRRSVSPHKMLLETSFCGSRPIPTRSMEMESPPKDLPDLGALLAECNKLAGLSNDMTAHCHKTVTTAQVHRHSSGDRSSIVSRDEDQLRTTNQKEVRSKSDASQYTLGVAGGGGGGGGEWNSVPYLHGSPESPKSSDLWQPISPRMELRSPLTPSTSKSQPHFHADSPSNVHRAGPFSLPSPPQSASLKSALASSNSRKTFDPFAAYESSQKNVESSSTTGVSTTTPATTKEELRGAQDINGKCSKDTPEVGSREQKCQALKVVGFQSEKSESGDQDTMEDEITTEMKISEDPTVTVEDVPIESKGLFFLSDSFDEEGDLPYVPTTLPQEKSTGVPIIPVSERKRMALMLTTVPVQRPKVNRPANPATLNDYIAYSNTLPKKKVEGVEGDETAEESERKMKMKINLPREDSLTNSGGSTKSPRKKMSTTWTDFANMGLRSPREIRRKMKEENGATDEISSYHSDSSSTNETPGVVDGADGDEVDSLLKLPKAPFGMDLDVHSNRSSVISQDEVQKSPSECSALLGSPDEPDAKKGESRE